MRSSNVDDKDSAHRSKLERDKRYRGSHRKERVESNKRWRDNNRQVYREQHRKNKKVYQERHPKEYRAIQNARNNIPLGTCCEFCRSVEDLMRFHPDYDYPLIILTVCRECRSWIKKGSFSE